MDNNLHATKNTFVFLDEILIFSRGNEEAHTKKVEEVLTVLDQAGLRLNVEKVN